MRSLYTEISTLIGATDYALVPMGDLTYEAANHLTVVTVGGAAGNNLTFTYSEASTAFDTTLSYRRGPYRLPVLGFNGVDERLTTPDAAFWSSTADGTAPNEPALSWSFWLKPRSTAQGVVMVKGNNVGATTVGEWVIWLNFTSALVIARMIDDSADAFIGRNAPYNTNNNVYNHIAVTYSGSALASGVKIYLNGKQVDNANSTSGTYTAMENTAATVSIGAENDGASWYTGSLAGGPAGPLFIQKALTLAEVQQLYEIGCEALCPTGRRHRLA